MTWLAVKLAVENEMASEAARWLVEQTGQAVHEESSGKIVGVVESSSPVAELQAQASARFGASARVSFEPLPEIDWLIRWQQGLATRRIGRLTLSPSWLVDTVAAGAKVLVIDPETAFGSGEHGSTRAALTLLDRFLQTGSSVVDLGSGSGILTIAAALLGARQAVGIEIDETAEPVAAQNIIHNGVGDRVTLLTGDAALLLPLVAPADLITANILRSANETLLPIIGGSLQSGGVAIFSGMEVPESGPFRETLRQAGMEVLDEVVDEGWWAVAARVI